MGILPSRPVRRSTIKLLWRALTDVPHIHLVRADLEVELALPPTLKEFLAAIHGHRGSTSPGATGFTYNMSMGWPPEVTQLAHRCLLLLWDQEETPTWMQWGWLFFFLKKSSLRVTARQTMQKHNNQARTTQNESDLQAVQL